MTKKRTAPPYAKDDDNLELQHLIGALARFGLRQNEVAELVGISPGQLSRIIKGERHAAWKHIRALRDYVARLAREQKTREIHVGNNPTLAAIDQAVLKGLGSTAAVEAFRDLIWARATERGIPVTKLRISSDVSTPDGGVDASIRDGEFPADELLSSGRRFQIKTGSFQPWQPSVVAREVFGGKARKRENLGAAVRRTLADGMEYVVVCFGVDPVDEKLRQAREHFEEVFKECGYPAARVEVWGQTELMGLFRQYPALCLRMRGHNQQGFRYWQSWAADADMQPPLQYSPELHDLVEDLREGLQSGHLAHVRLIGEPGIGKTRMALEITRAGFLAPVALYLRDPRALLTSSFLNELIQGGPAPFVVLVIDDCPRKDSAEIWNMLKTRSQHVRLVTIDHGPDTSVDEKMRIVEVPQVGDRQIVSILSEYGIGALEAGRWSELCNGCPRVAHVVGESLRDNRDVLRSPGIVDVWERFIVWRDDADSEAVQLRRTVLRHVSLFERFGFEPPVDGEGKFIADMAKASDRRITWPRFQEVIADLRRRRIVQGSTTLYITPRLLHAHLYRDFWRCHGSGFDIVATLRSMPAPLQPLFIAMLKFTDDSPPAQAAISRLLGPNGLFPDGAFPDTLDTGRLLTALAQSSPTATVGCLNRIIGDMDTRRLREIRHARQQLVWTLEMLAVRDECFLASAELLLKLAVAENATNMNNATGTFVGLFSLVPGLAATEASASRRIGFLHEALDSDSAERRRIAVAAAQSALSTQRGTRVVGVEHQGLQKQIEFWYPTNYGELWDAYREVWEMLVAKLDTWKGGERLRLVRAIVDSAGSVLHIAHLSSTVLGTLERLVVDPDVDVKGLLALVQRQVKYRHEGLSDDTIARLKSLKTGLDGGDFKTQLRRYVKYSTMYDAFEADSRSSSSLDEKLDALANDAVASTDLLGDALPWLVREESSPAFAFGFRVGTRDPERLLLSALFTAQESAGDDGRLAFLAGYLASIYERNAGDWERLVLSLVERPFFRSRFADLAISSGMSDAVLTKIVESCRVGLIDREWLRRWWFSRRLQQIDEPLFLELIQLQLLDDRPDLWTNALQMFHTYYLNSETKRKVPERATYQLLTAAAIAGEVRGNSLSYYWSQLATAFLAAYPHRSWELFGAVLRLAAREWIVLSDLDMSHERVLANLLKSDPERAWTEIAEALAEDAGKRSFGIQHWLGGGLHSLPGDDVPGIIQFVPSSVLFGWVDQDIEERAPWLAAALAKTLDQTPAGRLTRDFVARYGKVKSAFDALSCRFGARGWMGPASAHYRKLREESREWLVGEKNPMVIRWIENYIDGLSYDIQRAEIEEERRGLT